MKYLKRGFTIVELLVVIVVIGVLAAVTLATYTGISQKAIVASLKADLAASSQQIKLYQAVHSVFPVSVADCPTPAPSNLCLKFSQDNTFSYTYDNNSNPQTFSLKATNGTTSYVITESTAPTIAPAFTPVTAISAITGTPKFNLPLTVGSMTPSGATVSYQWQIATTSSGTYSNISGATALTYTPVVGDIGKFIKVVATGTDGYSGSVTSAATTVVVTNSVSRTVNGSAFTIMPGASQVMWGPDWWGEGDDTADVTYSSFDLAAYSTGAISSATISWSVGGTAGEGNAGGYSRYLRRNDGTLITSWNATIHPSNSNAAGVTTFANSGKGTTITFFWDSDAGDGGSNIWDIESPMSAPTLTFTWTP